MPASVHVKNQPGLLADASNSSIVEVSEPHTRPFLGEGAGRKAGKGNEVGPL